MMRFYKTNLIIYQGIILLAFITSHISAGEIADNNDLSTFARQIEVSIENNSPYFFNSSFDVDALIEKVINPAETHSDSAFNEGFKEGIRSSFDMGSVIINELGGNGTFKFLHAVERNNARWLVFRVISENGVNYHEYEVKINNGEYKITDGYFYLSGDKLSESISLIYNKYIDLFIHFGQEDEFFKAAHELAKLKRLYAEGKYKKAFRHWYRIPESCQNMKTYQCAKINIASCLDINTYLSSYHEFMTKYPDEPGKYLIPLDGLVNHGCFELALASIDSLDSKLMTDPLLDYFRANIYYNSQSMDTAKLYLANVIASIPDFELGYISLLNIYLTQKQFEEATVLLDKIVLNFNAYKEDLYPLLAEFPEYLKSKPYQDWINQ
jgi:hypothetical protein